MIGDQRKMLTEKLLRECLIPCFVNPCRKHHTERTFLTWQDLGDCKDKLVEKGLWKKFYWFAVGKAQEFKILDSPDTDKWLFRPTVDGEAHFCRLVAEFLKGEKG